MSYYRQGPFRPGGSGIAFGVPSLTPFVKYLIIANVGVWLLQLVLWGVGGVELAFLLGAVPERIASGWLFQPLTYMFLHATRDPMHLLFNMLMLWMFGGELERYWGSAGFLRYYVLCGLGGGLAAAALGLAAGGIEAKIPVIGASGALYGLFVAYGIIYAERTILFMLIFPMKARTMALIMVGLNFFYTMSRASGNVSYIAHLGGALVGFVYLKRAWRLGALYREARWRLRRRRFKVMPPGDRDDRWIH